MILVLCPTRGRPQWAREMYQSFRDNTLRGDTSIVLVCERDDPELPRYLELPDGIRHRVGWAPDRPSVMVLEGEGGTLVRATNASARRYWDRDLILGHVGDDHRFETAGWDERIEQALVQPGVAYANDGHWGEQIATAPFVSAIIPRTLGWLALPACRHNGWDNAVMDLGRGIESLHYLPDVRISHPAAEERYSSKDPGYLRARALQDDDKAALIEWRENGLEADVARLRAMLTPAT